MLSAAHTSLVLPLGDAGTICHSCLIFAVLFSRLILKTPITAWRAVATLILISGLMLIVKPSILFGSEDGTGKRWYSSLVYGSLILKFG